MTGEPWQNRVRLERAELNERIQRLEVFLHSTEANRLPADDTDMLAAQLRAMHTYSQILMMRIKKF